MEHSVNRVLRTAATWLCVASLAVGATAAISAPAAAQVGFGFGAPSFFTYGRSYYHRDPFGFGHRHVLHYRPAPTPYSGFGYVPRRFGGTYPPPPQPVAPVLGDAPNAPERPQIVEVFKSDGSLQCRPRTGESPARMARELRAADVRVLGMRRALDGLMHIALCGSPTGRVNVYKIAEEDLAGARSLGFEPFDPPPL